MRLLILVALLAGLLVMSAGSHVRNQPSVVASGAGNVIAVPDSAGLTGYYTSLVLDAAGNPVVSYEDFTNHALKLLHCGDQTCTTGNVISAPDSANDFNRHTSLVLDSLGNPVVAYGSTNGVKLLHCDDPNCSGGGESITFVDGNDLTIGDVALQLDALGRPVVAVPGAIVHCNDANCAPPEAGYVVAMSPGGGRSLVLDSAGRPVVSGPGLRLLHCGSPNCSGTNSVTVVDPVFSHYSSLALDTAGHPVISYSAESIGTRLKVAHCNDPNCSGADESITLPDPSLRAGDWSSIVLDAGGFPVVSYHDYSSGFDYDRDLKVLHCNDPLCSGGDESISWADVHGDVGFYTSLVLDAGGNPVVSYMDVVSYAGDGDTDLKLLHCGDPNCLKGSTTPTPTATPMPNPTWTPTPLPSTPTPPPIGGVSFDVTTPRNDSNGLRWLIVVVSISVVMLGGAALFAHRRATR